MKKTDIAVISFTYRGAELAEHIQEAMDAVWSCKLYTKCSDADVYKRQEEHRYIGRTDEPLSQKGREQLLTLQKKGVYPAAACVAASPLERCRQTAELLYPGQAPCVFDQFREMDFGAFEGHNYEAVSYTHL